MAGALAGQAGAVTGGARGIGREIAAACAVAGARVAVLDQDAEGARRAAAELGDGALGLGVDVTDAAAVAEVLAEVDATLGGLDFLVNNAGIRHIAPFPAHDVDVWRRTIDVNLTGTFICSQAAVRIMLPRGRGKIVNLASIAGELALRERAAYNASKAAVVGLTKSIATELGSQGIWCNAVAPGIVETPLSAEYFRDEAMTRTIVDNTPLGRWGQVHEIAGPVVFLCSEASDFVQGATLFVDGGWVAGKGY